MKTVKRILIALLAAMLLTGCAVSERPFNTEVDAMLKLRQGMSLQEASQTLNTTAYDVHRGGDTLIAVFNYKVKAQKSLDKYEGCGQLNYPGQIIYGKQKYLFLHFVDDKLIYFETK